MIGVVVLIVAILALRNPRHSGTTAGTDTRTVTPSALPSTPGSTVATSPAKQTNSSVPSGSTLPSGSAPGSGKSDAHPSRGSLPLIVLNDTTTPHLAREAAQRFEGGGWNVTSYDEHYQNVISSTVAYYDPSTSGAKRAAKALQRQFPEITRIAPRFAPAPGGDPLPDGPVVVVLTSDYTP